jgi:hypothetical protein
MFRETREVERRAQYFLVARTDKQKVLQRRKGLQAYRPCNALTGPPRNLITVMFGHFLIEDNHDCATNRKDRAAGPSTPCKCFVCNVAQLLVQFQKFRNTCRCVGPQLEGHCEVDSQVRQIRLVESQPFVPHGCARTVGKEDGCVFVFCLGVVGQNRNASLLASLFATPRYKLWSGDAWWTDVRLWVPSRGFQ